MALGGDVEEGTRRDATAAISVGGVPSMGAGRVQAPAVREIASRRPGPVIRLME